MPNNQGDKLIRTFRSFERELERYDKLPAEEKASFSKADIKNLLNRYYRLLGVLLKIDEEAREAEGHLV